MNYSGRFALMFLDADIQQRVYEMEFHVDLQGCESPGGRLRQIAYQRFQQENADGLSIEGCQPVAAA
ncbi:hypothetical protein HBA55_06100 [Pseudomaricurvus alkylphenolicus]|jgi:hypothetical protein|uniref:hypothetical protein n=1 Tax=Pseudomaricurvus alkylphenolicus TaxID=1306991 RepID=UPI0014207E01|nr:hypothetical protein [Pseudomaricurvus alkylphenolicus]NIB39148.1 hypothetical protein [Pseudomaricurvus alkylphenolicus]